jgi:RNA polymerase sigma-70 factor (ECF subfamily)
MSSAAQAGIAFLNQRNRLEAFIGSLVADRHAGEDILQEVWIRLVTAAEKGAEIDDVPRWCRATAKHLILHYWRAKKRTVIVPDEELLDLAELAFAEQPPDEGLWEDRRQALRQCVDKLPEKSRSLLTLKYDASLPLASIAEKLGQKLEAVTKSLFRLRQLLAECVGRELKTEGPR